MTNLPDWYYVALINSEFISLYVDNFINNTSHFQINDARQLPIVIPQKKIFESLQKLVADCISLKRTAVIDEILMEEKQYELDRLVRLLTLSKILCKWKQDSVVSLFLYLNSVFKHKHKLIHNQAPV